MQLLAKIIHTQWYNTKFKVFPVHAMKAYEESRGIASLNLSLGTRWECVFNFNTLAALRLERALVPTE